MNEFILLLSSVKNVKSKEITEFEVQSSIDLYSTRTVAQQ